ncbi:MAG: ankyrin repeat domain-containing protein [Xanthobacteraceae bacterium]
MPADQSALTTLIRAIGVDDAAALQLLAASPALATRQVAQGATRQAATDYYLDPIAHYVYAGDTALHVAAAAYRCEIAKKLIALGAGVRARNRRGAEPLHYAADGMPGTATWNPDAQAATIALLIAAGADPNAADSSGVRPLHRAVRTRCAAAAEALLAGGRRCACQEQKRHVAAAACDAKYRPRRLRLASGERAAGRDRAVAGGSGGNAIARLLRR